MRVITVLLAGEKGHGGEMKKLQPQGKNALDVRLVGFFERAEGKMRRFFFTAFYFMRGKG